MCFRVRFPPYVFTFFVFTGTTVVVLVFHPFVVTSGQTHPFVGGFSRDCCNTRVDPHSLAWLLVVPLLWAWFVSYFVRFVMVGGLRSWGE